MKYFTNLLILIQFLATVQCYAYDTINPANYLWINFSLSSPILAKPDGKCTTNIPCEARIGKCTCSYSVLPPGWQASGNTQITMPRLDAAQVGSFAIQGQCTQPTGEKLDINLVAKVENWFFTVSDSSQFYKKNGITFIPSGNRPTQYQASLLTKPVPDGFPTISQLERQIKNQDIGRITSIISDITSKYAPCRSKIIYLNSVKDLLVSLVKSNNDDIAARQLQINELEMNLSNQQNKKSSALLRSGIQAQLQVFKTKIQQTNKQILQLKLDQLSLQQSQQKYENNMKNYRINVAQLQSVQTVNIQKQIDKTNNQYQGYYNTNVNTNRSILVLKMQKYLKGLQSKEMEKAFADNIQYLVKSLNDLKNTEKKIYELYEARSLTNSFIAAVDKKIAQLKSRSQISLPKLQPKSQTKPEPKIDKQANQKKINQLTTINQQISKNIDYANIMKRYLGMPAICPQ